MLRTKILIYSLLLCLTMACSKVNESYIRLTGMVNISETVIPDSANVFENIPIKVKASETNGCWRNLNVVLHQINTFDYELKAYGIFESHGACPEVMVYKDTLINFRPDQKGTYLFYTIQKPYQIHMDTLIVR
jgi:hypothetical protein